MKGPFVRVSTRSYRVNPPKLDSKGGRQRDRRDSNCSEAVDFRSTRVRWRVLQWNRCRSTLSMRFFFGGGIQIVACSIAAAPRRSSGPSESLSSGGGWQCEAGYRVASWISIFGICVCACMRFSFHMTIFISPVVVVRVHQKCPARSVSV